MRAAILAALVALSGCTTLQDIPAVAEMCPACDCVCQAVEEKAIEAVTGVCVDLAPVQCEPCPSGCSHDSLVRSAPTVVEYDLPGVP